MDIKEWFENGTKLEIKELRYLSPPPLPYNIFVDDTVHRGADLKNNIIEHNVSIEHYSNTIDVAGEKIIEAFLDKEKKHYDKNREWLNEEKLFITVYELDTFIEKVKKEENINE